MPLRGQLGIEKSELRQHLGQLVICYRAVEAIHVRQIRRSGVGNEHSVDDVVVSWLVPQSFLASRHISAT